MTGHTRIKVANSVLWLLVLGVSNVLLVPPFGVVGAAFAHAISITVVNLARMTELWAMERVLPSWRAYLKPVLAGAVALGFGFGLKTVLPVGTALWPAVWQGAVVVAVYAGMIALLRLDDDDRDLMARARQKLSRRLRRRA